LEIFLWKFWGALFDRNGKGKSEIQGSFDLALLACAQDDDKYKRKGIANCKRDGNGNCNCNSNGNSRSLRDDKQRDRQLQRQLQLQLQRQPQSRATPTTGQRWPNG
jgi:hypothetical protein